MVNARGRAELRTDRYLASECGKRGGTGAVSKIYCHLLLAKYPASWLTDKGVEKIVVDQWIRTFQSLSSSWFIEQAFFLHKHLQHHSSTEAAQGYATTEALCLGWGSKIQLCLVPQLPSARYAPLGEGLVCGKIKPGKRIKKKASYIGEILFPMCSPGMLHYNLVQSF